MAWRGRARFGATWWGRAWIEALEQRARLDPNRLPRGRTYARSGAVRELLILPGEAQAAVQGSRASPYAVRLRVRQFGDAEWERVLRAIGGRAAHAAALIDGVLDPGIVQDAEKAGISLLPVAGELSPSCSCPDWADPCKHAAAVCYLIADRMDEDPFTILLLRGCTREQVLAALRRLRASDAGGASIDFPADGFRGDPGVEARSLFTSRAAAANVALPSPPLPPTHPGAPAGLVTDPPASSGLTSAELAALAGDAARRAFDLCHGVGDGGLSLDEEADLARLAADRLGQSGFDEFAARAGVPPRALMRLALAWAAGSVGALEVLNGPVWLPPREEMDEGASVVRAAMDQPVSARGNRITYSDAGIQLRYGRDGLWYLLVRKSGSWEIHDPPTPDPWSMVPKLVDLGRAADWRHYLATDDR